MKKIILLFSSIFTVVIISLGWLFMELTPVSSSKVEKRFLITNGETASQIGSGLQKEGILKSALAFRIYSQVTGSAKNIKAGSYDLPSNLWVPQVINKLLAGPVEIWVTIPEGLRREEIAQKYTKDLGLNSKESVAFYEKFLSLTENKEGYLFPDTYLFTKDASPSAIIQEMLTNFNKKYQSVAKSKTNNLTENDSIIIASIVQREAITNDDMNGVASVLENRLSLGMPLGSDVTLEYAIGKQPDGNWWKKDLTSSDLALASAYNTRLNSGLPPTPISNPGLVAIEGALNPPQTDYLYYLSDKNGNLHFAKTLEEHNANIAKYLE